MDDPYLSHVDDAGKLRMVDVSGKEPTRRTATAECFVVSTANVFQLPPVGPGLTVVHAARLAGIQAAKRTAQYIPLCHPLDLHDVDLEITSLDGGEVRVHSSVVTRGRTGVEMEALTACLFAALALVGPLRERDDTTHVRDLQLLSKTGGKSSSWGRDATPADPSSSPETADRRPPSSS